MLAGTYGIIGTEHELSGKFGNVADYAKKYGTKFYLKIWAPHVELSNLLLGFPIFHPIVSL